MVVEIAVGGGGALEKRRKEKEEADVRVEATHPPPLLLLLSGIFHKWIVTSIRDAVSEEEGGDPSRRGRKGRSINAKWPQRRERGGEKILLYNNENTRAYNSYVKVGQKISRAITR